MQTWAAGNSQRSARAALASVPPTGSPLELFTPPLALATGQRL